MTVVVLAKSTAFLPETDDPASADTRALLAAVGYPEHEMASLLESAAQQA